MKSEQQYLDEYLHYEQKMPPKPSWTSTKIHIGFKSNYHIEYDGQKIIVDIDDKTTFQDILMIMQKKFKTTYLRDFFCLVGSKSVYLNSNNTLKDFGVRQNEVIILYQCLSGGGNLQDIIFNSCTGPITLNFQKGAPKYRIVQRGLNLEGSCSNRTCEAYQKRAWAHKGYGKFNMSREVYCTNCPLCKSQMIEVNNLGIYNAAIKIQGKMKGEEKETTYIYEQNQCNFLTFENKDVTLRHWLYLEVQVQGYGWKFE